MDYMMHSLMEVSGFKNITHYKENKHLLHKRVEPKQYEQQETEQDE